MQDRKNRRPRLLLIPAFIRGIVVEGIHRPVLRLLQALHLLHIEEVAQLLFYDDEDEPHDPDRIYEYEQDEYFDNLLFAD